ncbi:Protein of unknown function DUF247 [Theobroma cacao]|nr:Protein of unknown function DUF247 [Theobroma cacao]
MRVTKVAYSQILKTSTINLHWKLSTLNTTKLEKVYLPNGAWELRKLGIQLWPIRVDRLMDIHSKDGVLEIPPVTVNDLFIAILVNCVALEHCSNGCPKDLITYACFMSRLIMFLDGAEYLCSDGIIPRFSNDDVQMLAKAKLKLHEKRM